MDSDASSRTAPHAADASAPTLIDLLVSVIESWRSIVAISVLCLAGAVLLLLVDTPIYQADVVLQLEEKSKDLTAVADIAELFDEESPIRSEAEIVTSRAVLGELVRRHRMDLEAKPRYVPVIGRLLARRRPAEAGLAPALFGLESFAWGGEQIELMEFDVPTEQLGAEYRLVAGEGGQYLLFDALDELVGVGEVGIPLTDDDAIEAAAAPAASPAPSEATAPAQPAGAGGSAVAGDTAEAWAAALSAAGGAAASPPDGVRLLVGRLEARPGTTFVLRRLSVLEAVDRVRGALKVAEVGGSVREFRTSGLMQVSLQSASRSAVAPLVNDVAEIYIAQKKRRRAAQATQTLRALEQELPELRTQLEQAEAELNAFRLQRGSVDIAQETEAVLDNVVATRGKLNELLRQRAQLRVRFTDEHNSIIALNRQIESLRRELGGLEGSIQALPGTQQEMLRLTRDVKVNTDLYTSLLDYAQELRLVLASTSGNASIVDYAVMPYKPVDSRRAFTFVAAVALGPMLGVGLALVRRGLRSELLTDPDDVEQRLGLKLLGTVPHSEHQKRLVAKAPAGASQLLVLANPYDVAVESLRGLRTALGSARRAAGNVIMITGPSPGVGKSFVSANLAAVWASAGERVALIDADLRAGRLHEYLGVGRGEGLADYLSGHSELKSVVRRVDDLAGATPGISADEAAPLTFISRGADIDNPAEALLAPRLGQLVKRVSEYFDVVIIDTPPVLAVTDAAILGPLARFTMLVVRSGRHSARELQHTVNRLKLAEITVGGMVFNDVQQLRGPYAYRNYYGYAYSYGRTGRAGRKGR